MMPELAELVKFIRARVCWENLCPAALVSEQ